MSSNNKHLVIWNLYIDEHNKSLHCAFCNFKEGQRCWYSPIQLIKRTKVRLFLGATFCFAPSVRFTCDLRLPSRRRTYLRLQSPPSITRSASVQPHAHPDFTSPRTQWPRHPSGLNLLTPLLADVGRRPLGDVPASAPLTSAPLRTSLSVLLNLFVCVDFTTKIWICPLCFSRNSNVPAELFPFTVPGLPR